MNTCIGIDPGRKGGIAVIESTGVIRVWKMPDMDDRGVDTHALITIFKSYSERAIAGLEWNSSRPENKPEDAFVFGLQTGQLDGVLRGLNIGVVHLAPTTWMNPFKLKGKDHDPGYGQRIACLRQFYPYAEKTIIGPKGGIQDGPLEALLIAHYVRSHVRIVDGVPVKSKKVNLPWA